MPITQERLISLLEAAQDYQGGVESLIGNIRGVRDLVRQGRLDAVKALDMLAGIEPHKLLSRPNKSPVDLERERTRILLRRRKNEREAKRMKRKRAATTLGPLITPTEDEEKLE